MNDPERLFNGSGNDLERRLLGAARVEQPSPALSARMAGALGLPRAPLSDAPVRSGTSSSPPPAAVTAATTTGGSIAAAVGVSAVVVGLALVGVFAFRPASRVVPVATTVSVPRAPTPIAPSPTATPGDEVGDQIRVLDAARVALRGQTPRRAIDLLDGYVNRYPRGTFRPEATVLRIEALVQDGRSPEAAVLGKQFRAAYPDSPLVKRVNELVSASSRRP